MNSTRSPQSKGAYSYSIMQNGSHASYDVATLALSLRPKQKLTKVRAKNEARGITFHALGSVGEFKGMNLHAPK